MVVSEKAVPTKKIIQSLLFVLLLVYSVNSLNRLFYTTTSSQESHKNAESYFSSLKQNDPELAELHFDEACIFKYQDQDGEEIEFDDLPQLIRYVNSSCGLVTGYTVIESDNVFGDVFISYQVNRTKSNTREYFAEYNGTLTGFSEYLVVRDD